MFVHFTYFFHRQSKITLPDLSLLLNATPHHDFAKVSLNLNLFGEITYIENTYEDTVKPLPT